MWLAAVIDCEGWIGLFQRANKNATVYWPAIGVGNTNRALTDKLFALTQRGYHLKRARPRPAKDVFTWTVSKRADVDDLLVTIRPYLLLKGAQADLVLSLPALNVRDNAARASIKAKLTVLNRKGVHALS